MTDKRIERQLAAILAADVADYGRLTDADEEGTHALLTSHLNAVVDPKISEYRGRTVKNTGDGLLAEFGSVVDAVRCAIDIQGNIAQRNIDVPQEKRIAFRIGINVGDIIIDRGDIFGDGVNVAVRLEGIAEPGGICVSNRVREFAQGQVDVTFEDAGQQQLKNIARAVQVYRVRLDHTATVRPALSLPNKPSVAVLPFQNISGDPEQQYFADGMVEDIITELSRAGWLFVIARNSSFTYQGRAVDVRQVGRELGVRYVLEGSVRKAAKRLRIAGQLIDASTGVHLWAGRFDGALEDIFELQDQMSASVVGAIWPKLEQAEIARAKRKPTEILDAYDYLLRGHASFYVGTRESNSEALRLFYRAIELDPDLASAYGMAADCYAVRKMNGWMIDRRQEIAETARLTERVAEVGRDDAIALCEGGFARLYVVKDLDAGASMIDRALVLAPSLGTAWLNSGYARIYLGEPDLAIQQLTYAMRLSPMDPQMGVMAAGMAFAHFLAGRDDEATLWAEKALGHQPNSHTALRIAAACNALVGREEKAREAMARLRRLNPALRLSDLNDLTPLRRAEDAARYAEGLHKAGLPD